MFVAFRALVDDPTNHDSKSFQTLSVNQQRIVIRWIKRTYKTCTEEYVDSSDVIRYSFFGKSGPEGKFRITNGQMKGAMLAAGIKPIDPSVKYWRFLLTLR